MSKGLEIKYSDLSKVEAYVQLFNGQKWHIKKSQSVRFTTFYVDGKPTEIEFATEQTKVIYPEIKLLFDPQGRVIAQRLNHNCRLLTTSENRWFQAKKKGKKTETIYELIQMLEEKEFVVETLDYLKS